MANSLAEQLSAKIHGIVYLVAQVIRHTSKPDDTSHKLLDFSRLRAPGGPHWCSMHEGMIAISQVFLDAGKTS